MIVSNHHGYVYLACPKTGSKTTVQLLCEHFGGKYVRRPNGSYVGHKRDIPSFYNRHLVFSTVRNPYPRMVSLWWEDTSGDFRKRRRRVYPKKESYVWFKNKLFGMCFYDWLEYIQLDKTRVIFCSQTKFFELVTLNHVVHLENFKREFKKLPFVGHLPRFEIIGQVGESKSSLGNYGDYRRHYKDPQVPERMHEMCHEDFERFGYMMGTL